MRHLLLGLVLSFGPIVSADCVQTASVPDGRRVDLEMMSHNAAFILGETPLPADVRTQVLDFIDKPETEDVSKDRQIMFYKQSALLKDRHEDLETLKFLMGGQRAPLYVEIDLHDKSFLDAKNEANDLYRKIQLKHGKSALCLAMKKPEDKCPPDVTEQEITDLMLLAVGPVLLLWITEPNLFDNTKVATINRDNLHSLAMSDQPQPNLVGDGDVVMLLDAQNVEATASDMTMLCKKALPKATPAPVNTAVATKGKAPVEKPAAAPAPKRSHRMVAYQHRAFYVQPPKRGREYLTVHGIQLKVWFTHDCLGRVYRHWGKYAPYNWRHLNRRSSSCSNRRTR